MSPKSTLLKAEILRGLDALGEGDLHEVHAHVTSLVEATGRSGSAREILAGIWKGRGFERLSDLESEIREAREELGTSH